MRSTNPLLDESHVFKCRRPDRILSPLRGLNLLLTYLAGVSFRFASLHPCLCSVQAFGLLLATPSAREVIEVAHTVDGDEELVDVVPRRCRPMEAKSIQHLRGVVVLRFYLARYLSVCHILIGKQT